MNTQKPDACPDVETLAAQADGVLDATARSRVEAHVARCGACRAALRDLVRVVQADTGAMDVPAGLAQRILDGLPDAPVWTTGAALPGGAPSGGSMNRIQSRRTRLPLTASALTAAAVLLVGLASFFWFADRVRDESSGKITSLPGSAGVDRVAGLPEALPAAQGEAVVPPLPSELGGEVRYLAHVGTDKPVYRPGETLYARAVLLDAFTHRPVPEPVHGGTFEVRGARGQLVFQGLATAQDGVAALHWTVPPGGAGGTFKLFARFPSLGMPESETTFDVRTYRVPRLKTDLQFVRKAYGPGDEVRATLTAERAEGGLPAGARVTAIARLDGAEVYRGFATLDAAGRCAVSFHLPDDIADGIGTLALRVEDGGVTETAAKTLPIVLHRVDLALYPEGGDLVAGVPCGLYFEARTPRDDPADVAGVIVDDEGSEVARFASVHEGRGRTSFTPVFGRTYRARLEKPAGIDEPVLLPVVKGEGLSLRASRDTYAHAEPVVVAVASAADTAATVGLYVREKELALRPVRLQAGQPVRVTLAPGSDASGVLRVTVFDDAGVPRAERLVFRRPKAALTLELQPESAATIPGGPVRVNVRALDAHGRPVPNAVVGLAATDDALLATVEPRERAPRLPVQALLGAEVRELRDPAEYLGPDLESAARVDLLLGTQGWRRFCFFDADAFVKDHAEAGRRALAYRFPVLRASPAGIGVAGGGAGDQVLMERLAALEEMAALQNEGAPRLVGAPVMGAPAVPVPEPAAPAAAPVAGRPDAPPPEPEPVPEMPAAVEEVEEEAKEDIVEVPAMREPRDPEPPAPPLGGPVTPMGGTPAAERRLEALGKDDFRGYVAGALPGGLWRRVYAHKSREDRPPNARSDFTETVYWNAGLVTDAEGRASFAFDASDAITTLRIRADGFTRGGALGSEDALVEVKRPFYVEPKFPLEVSAGDRIQLPIALVNGTAKGLPLTIRAEIGEGMQLVGALPQGTEVAADSSVRLTLPLAVQQFRGTVKLRLRATAGPYADDVTRTIQVVPAGFPMQQSFGGVLEGVAQHEVTIPASYLPGSVTTEVAVYPTPLASMAEALSAMLREPHGCFEQTSSTNYPNVMALQYMQSHAGVEPAFIEKATALLERGYKKLLSFECKQRGYEWFGGDPGHEALTAYGVLEFHDMAQVMTVDAAMIERTRKWLLDRRDGDGGFSRNPRALDRFGGAPAETTNAYILWVLSEVGATGLEKEMAGLERVAKETQDSYVLALAANALWKFGDHRAARRLMDRLAKQQDESGALKTAKTSITRSGGASLHVETTALAVLAWLRTGEHTKQVESAMRWISEQCQGGRFGSTQATILALKAVIAYDKARAKVAAPGVVVLSLDGQPLHEVPFSAGHQGTIRLPDLAETLGPGTHKLRLEMRGGGVMPYSISVNYNALTPSSASAALVGIETRVAQARAVEGEPVEVRVDVVNRSEDGQPMAVAIVGLPGGLEVRSQQLKELVREGRVDAIETRGREVILYWRSLAPSARHALTLDCVAAVPGTYEGPASRAYLYYTDEDKAWVDGLKLEISPR